MTALTLIDAAGEVVQAVDAQALLYAAGIADVQEADTADLAVVTDKLSELRKLTIEAGGVLSDELVNRMDMSGKWTLHEGDYTIKSSSPDAGTVSYDVEALRAALTDLRLAGVISAEGANAALEVTTPTAPIPYVILRHIRDALNGRLDQSDEQWVRDAIETALLTEPEPTYRVKAAGVKALLKLPRAREAIEACQVAVEPPRRRATVKRAA